MRGRWLVGLPPFFAGRARLAAPSWDVVATRPQAKDWWRVQPRPLVNSIVYNSAVAWLAFVAGPAYGELFAAFGGLPGMYPLATKIFLSTCACWGVIPLGMAVYWLGFPMESRRHYRVMTGFGRVVLAAMVVLFLVGAYGYLPGKLGSVDVPSSELLLDTAAGTGSAGECQ